MKNKILNTKIIALGTVIAFTSLSPLAMGNTYTNSLCTVIDGMTLSHYPLRDNGLCNYNTNTKTNNQHRIYGQSITAATAAFMLYFTLKKAPHIQRKFRVLIGKLSAFLFSSSVNRPEQENLQSNDNFFVDDDLRRQLEAIDMAHYNNNRYFNPNSIHFNSNNVINIPNRHE